VLEVVTDDLVDLADLLSGKLLQQACIALMEARAFGFAHPCICGVTDQLVMEPESFVVGAQG